jgi:hypothetical protein
MLCARPGMGFTTHIFGAVSEASSGSAFGGARALLRAVLTLVSTPFLLFASGSILVAVNEPRPSGERVWRGARTLACRVDIRVDTFPAVRQRINSRGRE